MLKYCVRVCLLSAFFALSGTAQAALMRVDFSGSTSLSGAYDGHFIFDISGFDPNALTFRPVPGPEVELQFRLNGFELFDETSASLFAVEIRGGSLIDWLIGGDLSGSAFSSFALPDFDVQSTNGGAFQDTPGVIERLGSPEWRISTIVEVPDEEVPGPNTLALFAIGLAGLGFAVRRRKG